MRHPFRRCFLFLFTLLQCVAPLLHGHVHAGGHGGIHLPGCVAQAHADAPACSAAEVVTDEGVVALAHALKPRVVGGEAMAGPYDRAAGAAPPRTYLAPAHARSDVLPAPPSHLIPLPGAPPAA
ncbi:MAG: hypothetical protein ACUVSD_01910 [Thiobacillaceae bacterium]